MTKQEIFSRNLNRLMDAQSVKQADIATTLDVQRSTVSRWCDGTSIPKSTTLIKLATCLNTSPSSLLNVYTSYINDDEEKLLRSFRSLSAHGKKIALERMNELSQLYWYDIKEKVL